MNLYKICDLTWKTKGFAYASGFGPISDSMPFLSPEQLTNLKLMWGLDKRNSKAGFHIADKGTKWGDVLAYPIEIAISRKILSSITSTNCKITHITRMPIGLISNKKLIKSAPPDYFIVQPQCGLEIDWDFMNIALDQKGFPVYDRTKTIAPVAKLSTWNGHDVFSWSNWGHNLATTLLCTEKVVQLASKEGWTNVYFEPLVTH